MFDPAQRMASGYSAMDGTVEFMLRVNSLITPVMRVLDVGAGRAGWVEHTKSKLKIELRSLRGKCAEYVGIDIDKAVLENKTTDINGLIVNGVFPIKNESIDLILSDFVLEHVDDPSLFFSEVDRVLKPGGWFCARTPHKWHYVSIAARFIKNDKHSRWIKYIQPNRKGLDVFPTTYRMNTIGEIRRIFRGFEDFSYIYPTEPSYFFGSEVIYKFISILHRVFPIIITGNLMVFMRKPRTACSK